MSAVGLPVLYSFWRSSCAWRVRIALKLKGIPFETKTVNLMKAGGEQYKAEYREVNPMQTVPVLRIDGSAIVDSLNILQYLEETRPQKPLLPDNALERAKVREICQIIVAGIQPLQNLGVLNYYGKNEEQQLEWAQHWINRGFKALEKVLEMTAKKYCVGNEITLADCCVYPQVYNARKYKVDLELYPVIVRIEKELEKHPAFVDTHPSRQPDCPLETRK